MGRSTRRARIWRDRGPLLALSPVLALTLAVTAPGAASGGSEEGALPATETARSDEDVLRERATRYWQARVKRSPEVLGFYVPPEKGGPSRSKDVSEFGNLRYGSWQIEGVQVEGEEGTVEVRIQAALPVPPEVQQRFASHLLREAWIKVDGTWYKKPIPRGFLGGAEAAPTGGRPGASSGGENQ